MSKMIDLSKVAEGALEEKFNIEFQKVLENILDPNTDSKTKRKITLTVVFEADDKRDVSNLTISAVSKLAPSKSISTKIMMDRDNNGKATGSELKSGIKGQTYMDADGDAAEDTGEKIKNAENKKSGNVISFK